MPHRKRERESISRFFSFPSFLLSHTRARSLPPLQHARSLTGARRALSGAMSDGAAADPPASAAAEAPAATTTTADAAAAAGAGPSAPAAAERAAPRASPDAERKGKVAAGSAPKRRFAAGRVSFFLWNGLFFLLLHFDGGAADPSMFFSFFSLALISLCTFQKITRRRWSMTRQKRAAMR